jgi:CubicO group peptidase (beta-lactamase class C family)
MLANSTSRYIDYVPIDSFTDALKKDPFGAWTDDELIKMSTAEPLLYEPGTNMSYSHANFEILGAAPSAISGKPVDELIRERIIEPLGMRGTESYQTAEIPERCCTPTAHFVAPTRRAPSGTLVDDSGGGGDEH